ncbi:MAG TPA: putative toxin-antitoxin system toxin component, PIN family [Candidatus Omnitrophota bacterium]|nr:putative toxin-antitoxin system toxin component, PIN family [Candidatus Omnitrophota bacterium]
MKVVVDTNVLVSGILSAEGPPGRIVDWIIEGHLRVCCNSRIIAEYELVLRRPKLALSGLLVARLLTQMTPARELASGVPLLHHLPDASDEVFLEAALAGSVDCLITGNLKHFPLSCRQGMRVLSPKEFLEFYADRQSGGSGKVKSPSTRYKAKRRRS